MKIYFVRHGETHWNTERRFQGRKNSPLTPQGWEQAKKIAENLEKISFQALYSSSLGRARDTIQEIQKGRNIKSEIMDEFIEISMGELEGKTKSEFEKEYPKEFMAYQNASLNYTPEVYRGESFEEIKTRLERGLQSLVKRHQEGDTILVVSHGMTLQILFATLRYGNLKHLKEERLPKNTEIRVVEYRKGKFNILQG